MSDEDPLEFLAGLAHPDGRRRAYIERMDASVESLLAHRGWLRRLAAALADPGDADDLEQEAWLAALERPPAAGSGRAWLATVLRRTASRMRRTLYRRAARERAAARPEAGATDDLAARAETHERVVRAVLALPEPYRSTILFRFFEGLSPKEIARRTATPLDTVKARLRRGLARLREAPESRSWALALLPLPRHPLGVLAMTLKTKLAIAAAALLVAGSAVTYRTLDRADASARAAPESPAPLAALDPPDGGGATAPETPSPPAPRRDCLVAGTVTGAPYEFVPFALAEIDGERRLLEPLTYGFRDGGRFAVHVPLDRPGEIEFGVLGRGFVRQARRLDVEPGGEYRADFAVEPGVGIAGAVADGRARPVAGLRILAVAQDSPPHGLATAYDLHVGRRLVESEHFADAVTDEAGRFEITGLPSGTYALFSRSEEWILEHGPLVAPEGDARVLAVPAHAITGTIRDARTGSPVARATVFIELRTPRGSGCTMGLSAWNGGLWVVWKPQHGEEEDGCDTTVRVIAAGYHAADRALPFAPGTRRVTADILLDPVEIEKLAVLRMEVADTRGRLVDEELGCSLTAADDPKVLPTAVEFRPVAAGVYELRAPSGRWSVSLAPRNRMGEPLSWTGTVELGRDECVRCALPPFGVVRLRRGATPRAAMFERGNASYSWSLEKDETRILATPGEWEFGLGEGTLRTIVVLDGAETVVDVE